MIDTAILRELGWSEDLISEVTRKSEMINLENGAFQPIEEPLYYPQSISGTTLYMDKQEMNTSLRLSVITKK